ncbi:hypothetical protein [Orenia marismortui]|uniref:hypothetical protein n=1 Tax=Orenia marismortui TaxID=46469 RepID=UPI000377475B|nr:hypothetical protein [Orenia marismortui]
MKRVKFYSINDLACGHYLINGEHLIREYQAGKPVEDINDMIELYNIKKYFDNKIYLSKWTPKDIKNFEDIIRYQFGKVARFLKSINQDDFIIIYNNVERNYKDDFWQLIEKLEVYKNINQNDFQEFMNTSEVPLYGLLKNKRITYYFGETIRKCMLNDCQSAEILLDKYEIKHITKKETLYLPKELTNKDKENIIHNYIESENPNLNYLRLIANIQSNKDKIELSPKTLLKAKKKVVNQEDELLSNGFKMVMKTTVEFSDSHDEETIIKVDDQAISAKYNRKWIKSNMDYATLLNNFIYLFEFVDLQMRFNLVNKFNQMGVIERFGLISSQSAYRKGVIFDRKNILSLLQINGYYNELFSLGIRLEEVIEWFFEEYLMDEFNAYKFKINMPSISSTMLEKCTNIMPAMESVLKQFILFVEEGEIDFELLEIRSEHMIYKKIPSLVDKKYAYGIGDIYKTATFLLFSDQSGLGYSEKTKKSYENYFELLCNEKFKLDDYPDYCISEVKWLLDYKYLSTDKEDYIIFSNKRLVTILRDLYFNEVISYWKCSEAERKIIDELGRKNIIEFESTLFSRPEQAYINYFLNKSQFNNGLDLRNKYVHTQPSIDDDREIHYQNYITFLRLFILVIIKINDDFCILDKIWWRPTSLNMTLATSQ